jgi:hypothetical protein
VTELLLIGGRSGVGKTTVGFEVSAQLQRADVAHCLVDGDHLGFAYPKPKDDPHGTRLTQANLAALWQNCRALGYTRLIYVNSVCVLPDEQAWISAVVGAQEARSVLLTADDISVAERLGHRELGSELAAHLRRSARTSTRLERSCPPAVTRVPTADVSVQAVAAEVLSLVDWTRSRPA